MRILLLSPHTDDIELGCGGSIVRFLEEGAEIYWMVFSIAEDSIPKDLPKNILKLEFLNILKDLQIKESNSKIFNFKVRQLHLYRQEILDELIKVRNTFAPQLVIGPSEHDFHQDHQVISNEMIRAFKTSASIISFELPWNHVTFNSQLFSKLTEHHIQRKYELLQNYKSQFAIARPYFSKEFVYGLAKVRGVQCNSDYAEAFEVTRWIF